MAGGIRHGFRRTPRLSPRRAPPLVIRAGAGDRWFTRRGIGFAGRSINGSNTRVLRRTYATDVRG